ncbi:MAG TPA: peptidylprolyl isomerase [Bacteroidales bacterium]|nr:peptidylprolyl isomerase [Bacteroidales bacterium]HRW94400.1 peptidylprolyl isomerase [Bacteroidales bacterium]
MKQITFILLISMSALVMGSCNNAGKKAKDQAAVTNEEPAETVKAPAFDPAGLPPDPVFELKTTQGTMTIRLYSDTPLHRDNFVKLASERYYDNILFHRVIEGFMIQCGDPDSRNAGPGQRLGSGGPGYTVPAEFVPELVHKKGAIAAARTGDSVNPEKASSGSQFYIVHNETTCRQLDGNYTVFGEVIEGLDIIDKIAAAETGPADRPVKDIRIISVLPVL